MKKLINAKIIIAITILGTSLSPTVALAIVQSVNGQTGQTQSFANDTNVTMTSSGDIHSLGWSGFLSMARGGTGTSTSFSNGSILFSNGTSFSQNNSNLFWDNTNRRLGIGTSTPTSALGVIGNASISGNLNVAGDITSNNLVPYTGATQDVDLGTHTLTSSLLNLYNVPSIGSIDFYSDAGSTIIGSIWLESMGQYFFYVPDNGVQGILNFSGLDTSNKTFTFPNQSGTLGLIEADQTWSGLNKFEAGTNSTIYVGSSVKSGCIAMGDSDGSGVTYITANDGVLSGSSTKPSICQ